MIVRLRRQLNGRRPRLLTAIRRGEHWRQTFSSLEVATFRVLWFGMLFSTAAIQMNIVARAWLAYDITGSGLAIGLVAIARGVPRFFVAPFAGVAADRFDKRRMLIVTQVLRAGLSIITAVLVMSGVIEIWQLMVIGAAEGITASFMMPTRTAFISDLVGEERLPNAIALDATGRNLNRVIGPALAGVLIAIDPAMAFYVIAALYVFATMTMRHLPGSEPSEVRRPSVLNEAVDGFRYIRDNKIILGLMSMAAVIILLGMPFRSLLPVFQKDVLEVGPTSLGLMYTSIGIGAITASLIVAYIAESPHKRSIMVGSAILFGVLLSLFAVSGIFIISLLLLMLIGFVSQSYMTLNKTLLMLHADRRMYGRVMSVNMMTFSLVPVALLVLGWMVDSVGPQTAILISGVILLGAAVTGGVTQGVLRRDRLGHSMSHGSD